MIRVCVYMDMHTHDVCVLLDDVLSDLSARSQAEAQPPADDPADAARHPAATRRLPAQDLHQQVTTLSRCGVVHVHLVAAAVVVHMHLVTAE